MHRALLTVLAAVAVGCGTNAGANPTVVDDGATLPTPTIGGVGQLPNTIPREREPLVVFTRPIGEDGQPVPLVGDKVRGNRVLLIGDSIMASTATRYGGEMCDALVPLGWNVAVDAEPGRFVEFGNQVLDVRLASEAQPADAVSGVDDEDGAAADADDSTAGLDPVAGALDVSALAWDSAVVFLGSNYRSDSEYYEAELREIVTRLAPRPTVLVTVTEYRSSWAQVNEIVRRIEGEYDNVDLADWNLVARTPGVLSGDGLHPTDEGELVLADLIVASLGTAPSGEGECASSPFTDDSAIGGGSASPASRGSSTGGSSRRSSTGGSSSGGSSSGGSSRGGSSGGGSTSGSGSSGSTGGSTSGGSGSTSDGSSTGDASDGTDGGGDTDPSTTGGDTEGGSGGTDGTTDGTGGDDSTGGDGGDSSGSSGDGSSGSSGGDSSDGTDTSSGGSTDGSGSGGATDGSSGGSDTGGSTADSTGGSSSGGSGASTSDSGGSSTTGGSSSSSSSSGGSTGGSGSGSSSGGSSGDSTTGGGASGSSGGSDTGASTGGDTTDGSTT